VRAPPADLFETLTGLGLATAGDFALARRRVRRLAGKSAMFDSVWVDALVQVRAISLFQAAAINRGEAQRLVIGPFAVIEPICPLGSFGVYRARQIDTHIPFRLLTAEVGPEFVESARERLEQLVRAAGQLEAPGIAPLLRCGAADRSVWGAHPQVHGQTASDFVARSGRMSPHAVLAIAQQTVAALAQLEAAGLVHGDLSPRELVIETDGRAVITAPGFRSAVRREEGYGAADLPPEAYDSLAPERVEHAAPSTAASDRFALGVLWWQLLSGRSPWPAGNTLTRMSAIEKARLPNIRFIAPDTPEPLANAIEQCTARDPRCRPSHYAELAESLVMAAGQKVRPSRLPARSIRPATSWRQIATRARPTKQTFLGLAGMAACVAFVALVVQSKRPAGETPNAATIAVQAMPVPLAASPTEPTNAQSPSAAAQFAGQGNSGAVAAVSYEARNSWEQRAERAGGAPELILPTDRPLRVASLRLLPGQIVRGASGGRPRISTPDEGLLIDVEGLRFVDIDFVADREPSRRPGANRGPSQQRMLHLRVLKAAFEHCTFEGEPDGPGASIAIDWNTSSLTDRSSIALTNAQLEIKDCVFTHVAAGINCQWNGALALAIDNVLHLGPGPLVRLARAPLLDEPVGLLLAHVTARGGASLLELRCDVAPSECGRIAVSARECVIALHAAGNLLAFTGQAPAEPLAAAIEWDGQGSVLAPQAGLAAWRGADGKTQPIDTTRLHITGLVKSDVGFAGAIHSGPAASRAIRWQVPLQSPNPPGINETRLPAATIRNR
jgi:hypothetical protein